MNTEKSNNIVSKIYLKERFIDEIEKSINLIDERNS